MPRSKASRGRGRGRGGASGNRSTGTSFVPFAGATEQNGNHGFSLQFEALNTQRHQLSDSDQRLRHAKVNFVSAVGFESSKLLEPEAALAEMSLQDDPERIVPQQTLVKEESSLANVDEAHPDKQDDGNSPFFIDTEGDHSVSTGLPPPNIRPSSPTPSDSSEEVIVFAGRDKVGRGISRNPALSREHSRNTYDSQIKVIDGKIEQQKLLLASLSKGEAQRNQGSQYEGGKECLSLPSRSGNNPNIPTPPKVETDFSHKFVPPLRNRPSARSQKSRKKIDEQALLDDYIANMEAEEVDQLGWYNQRDLGGADSDAWQDTDVSSKSRTKRRSGGDGWGRDELCDFDNLSTSDGVFDSVQAILSKRVRESGLQYLVVWEGQGVDEARWVPRLNLTDLISVKLIGDFEADEKLVAEMLDDDDDDTTSSDGDYDDSLSIDGEVDNHLEKLDLKQRRIERLTDDEIARLLSKQEELGMGSAELLLFHNQEGDQDGEEEMEIRIVPKQTQPGKRAMRTAKKPRRDFPAASALADAYDGFDVMDFERPSLKKKPKGRKGKLSFDLSDSELETSMEMAWNNDRMMKKQKKEEREELRALGLLGNKKNKPDLKAKYKEGMGITAVKDEIKEFLKGDNTTLTLPPMDKADRKVVHEIASAFNLKSKSAGSGNKRFPILYRTPRTSAYSERAFDAIASRLTRRFFPRLDVKGKNSGAKSNGNSRGGFASAAVSYRDGDIVGGSAPELGMENKGRAMLEKMGWSSGTALGALNNKGILQPVSHVVKTTKAGLG